MAHHKSAQKRIRQTAKRRTDNRYHGKTTRNAIRKCAHEVLIAALAVKKLPKPAAIAPDFVSVYVPNEFVIGFGMDVAGAWRNLPAIYAL